MTRNGTARALGQRIHLGRGVALALALSAALASSRAEAARSSPGKVENGAFDPGRAGAAQYGPDKSQECGRSLMVMVLGDAEDAAKSSGKPKPEQDGQLCSLADAFLGWTEAAQPLESAVGFVAWHVGLTSPPRLLMARAETEDFRQLSQQLQPQVAAFAAKARFARLGVATQRVRKGVTRVVLAMQEALLDVDPLPRKLDANGTATLSGRLLGGLANPTVLVSGTTGELETAPAQAGTEFKTELKCGPHPGKLVAEVRGEAQGQAVVAGRLVVTCGVDQPATVPIPPAEKAGPDVAQKERKLFEMVNAERAGAGQPPLAWDDSVAKVARASSEAAARSGGRGGSSHEEVTAELKRAEVVSSLVLMSPGAGRSAEETQALMLTSPAHRASLLNAQATHGGVGIVLAPEPDGSPVAYVSELVVRQLPPVDPEALRAKLREAIARKRADARASPLAGDPTLEETAQRYATELAAAKGSLPAAKGDAIVAPLYKAYLNVNMVSGAKPEPLDMAEEPAVTGKGKSLGVGVAQGFNPVLGKNAVYTVIVLGTKK